MAHNSRKKRNADKRGSQRDSAPEEESQISQLSLEHSAVNRQRGRTQVPFYDDANHVAYGWQQMSVLPDTYNLVGGTVTYPPMSLRSRPENWPVESPSDDEKDGPSGFNPHPGHGLGPRRPRPLTESEGRFPYSRAGDRNFRPFIDPAEAEQEDANAGADEINDRSTLLALAPKDVNRKLGGGRSQVLSLSKVTDGRREKSRPRSKRVIVDEVEEPREIYRDAERMVPLHEEPAPLRIRKKLADKTPTESSSTLEQDRMLRAEQQRTPAIERDGGVALQQGEPENEDMKSLMATITEQLSAFTMQSEPQFEHCSAVSKPRDLGAIKAVKEKRRRARLRGEVNDGANGDEQGRKIWGSVESFVTGTSSEFERLSTPENSEHNGAKPK
ncbi:hypothetical protein SLS61_002398 [Didymella pomorum]